MLDFRTETFLTVCDYMNYTKAAEALNMTQPAISGHIRYLEKYYGVKLFNYENKKLILTKQGERLKWALQSLVHDELRLKKELAAIKEPRVYRIGATLSVGDYYLPKFLANYLSKHREMELAVTVANTATLLDKLDHGLLDIVLTEGNFSKDVYEHQLIKEEPFAIFCGMDYDIKDAKKFEDLFLHRFIAREPGSGTRAVFEHYMNEKGYTIKDFAEKCEFSSMRLITEMLMNNQGISVLYRCVGEHLLALGKLREIKIPGFDLMHDFNALWQKNSIYSSINTSFLEELRAWQEDVR